MARRQTAESFKKGCSHEGSPNGTPSVFPYSPGGPGLAAVTLIELLCVIAIIAILASMLLPTVLRAYSRAREFNEEMEGPSIIEMIRSESCNYCVGHPTFQFTGKTDFAEKCAFAPKPGAWVVAWKSEFVPFSYTDPTNKVVLSFHYGRKQLRYQAFTRGDLSVPTEKTN